MNNPISLNDIVIRTELRPGDIGYLIYLHGLIYNQEYHFGIDFESYVAHSLHEFYSNYDPAKDRVWICEHNGTMVGSLALMHRDNSTAQLRYFVLQPAYRGIGLGNRLMDLFMQFFRECGYTAAYLWTTHELTAAATLYTRYGFVFTEEKHSTAFGKSLMEQRYDLKL